MNLTFFQSTCSPSTWQWLYNKAYSTWINCRFDLAPQWELRQVDYTYRPCNPSPWSCCRAGRLILAGSWSLLWLLLQHGVVKQPHKQSNVRVHARVMYGLDNLCIFSGCVEMFLPGDVQSASWTAPKWSEDKLENYGCNAKFSKTPLAVTWWTPKMELLYPGVKTQSYSKWAATLGSTAATKHHLPVEFHSPMENVKLPTGDHILSS